MPVMQARTATHEAISTFLKAADAWHAKQAQKRNPFEEHAKTIIAFNPPPPPPVHAIRVATGAGKTEISARDFAGGGCQAKPRP